MCRNDRLLSTLQTHFSWQGPLVVDKAPKSGMSLNKAVSQGLKRGPRFKSCHRFACFSLIKRSNVAPQGRRALPPGRATGGTRYAKNSSAVAPHGHAAEAVYARILVHAYYAYNKPQLRNKVWRIPLNQDPSNRSISGKNFLDLKKPLCLENQVLLIRETASTGWPFV